jgi:hypothetical protein
MPIESLVRPFQTNETTPPRRVVPSGARARTRVRLVIGGTGGAKTMSGSYSYTMTKYMDSAMSESTTTDEGKFIQDPINQDGQSVPQYYG